MYKAQLFVVTLFLVGYAIFAGICAVAWHYTLLYWFPDKVNWLLYIILGIIPTVNFVGIGGAFITYLVR